MVVLLKEIAAKWDIDVIDLWDEPSFCNVSPEDYSRYMADPIHPNTVGYRDWWGPFIEAHIRRLLAV